MMILQTTTLGLHVCLPKRVPEPDYIYLAYADDLIMSAVDSEGAPVEDLGPRKLDKYDDMSATMSWAGGLKTAIVRGMPYATVWYEDIIPRLTFGSPILSMVVVEEGHKFQVLLENGQTWLIYAENYVGYKVSCILFHFVTFFCLDLDLVKGQTALLQAFITLAT